MLIFLKSICYVYLVPCLFLTCSLQATWSPTVNVSSFIPHVANGMDASGKTVLLWNDTSLFDGTNIYSAFLNKDQEVWSVLLKITSTKNQIGPVKIGVDQLGNAVAVWEENDGSSSVVKASLLPFDGIWSIPIEISAHSNHANQFVQISMNPEIAMAPSGYAVVIWQKNDDDSQSIIQSTALQFGEDWSSPIDISQSLFGPFHHISIDSSGNAVAIWIDSNQEKTMTQVATLPHKGKWSIPITLSKDISIGQSQVAINPSGYAVAVWTESRDLGHDDIVLYASTMQFGGNWSTPVEIAKSVSLIPIEVAIDLNGNAIVVWGTETIDRSTRELPFPSENILYSSYLPHLGKPTKREAISEKGEYAYSPRVVFDGSGNAFIVWNNHWAIQAARRPFEGKWSDHKTLSDRTQNEQPQICVDSTGYAVVNWINQLNLIQATRWTTESATVNP